MGKDDWIEYEINKVMGAAQGDRPNIYSITDKASFMEQISAIAKAMAAAGMSYGRFMYKVGGAAQVHLGDLMAEVIIREWEPDFLSVWEISGGKR